MKNIAIILLCVCLCELCANDLDVVDSKGRSFWDKKFVCYQTNKSQIAKTCGNEEYFKEQGLQFDRESRSIIIYTPMERIDLIVKDYKDKIILQGNKFIFLFVNSIKYNPQDVFSLEFLNDTLIQWCMFEVCGKYVLCPN
ncbi:hypothetical protein LS70_009805 [Helicobacter sp. MIT 11-5569]|uniref:hypothetical protein n=1 Tax=Helicobacter sp. MIT 11-5569 TaxID=1548151 RepID=UPI00051FADED|nr:hypothetical protein [Helicobacter sp. MIT 11-5569]TLD79669.1 hypothetical protein LS70_009805 [Helicobacter sp. MIT 11-5569]